MPTFSFSRLFSRRAVPLIAGLAIVGAAASASGKAIPVKIVRTAAGWAMTRGGKPYFIKGAGGNQFMHLFKQSGGNTIRTWGADHSGPLLTKAKKLGLAVTIGIWLGHKGDGFHYSDAAAVHKQYEQAKQFVLKYRNRSALLMWGVGNEMENGNDTPQMWKAVEQIAKMIHRLDPAHPTMTVVAEIGGHKVAKINKYCPDLDAVGINSYGGGASVGARYRQAGGVKPYVITEFGPAGSWELPKDQFGVTNEQTSTQKALAYKATYEKSVLGQKGLCLGSYVFYWGGKGAPAPQYYSVFMPNGDRLSAVNTMAKMWSGKTPAVRCPQIQSLRAVGPRQVPGGGTVRAAVKATDPDGLPLTYHWVLYQHPNSYNNDGAFVGHPPSFPGSIVKNGQPSVSVHMPNNGGVYRLYCMVYNSRHAAADGNIVLDVHAPEHTAAAPGAKLPLYVFSAKHHNAPFIASGWMGDVAAIKMDANCLTKPHGGAHCLEFKYTADGNWGGVVWQNPANNWGKQRGGFDLTGAKTLSFWVRGKTAGSKVTFGYGLIGRDAKYYDSSKGKKEVTLSTHWKKYTINLAGKNMKRVVSGFYWTLGGSGNPVTFYLSDIVYK